jgi:ribose transport system ATP-binding protein
VTGLEHLEPWLPRVQKTAAGELARLEPYLPRVGKRARRKGELLLSVRGLCCEFGSTRALREVDLDLHAGEIVALLGKNGAGKSTLIKILAGVYQPTDGEVQIDGKVFRDGLTSGDSNNARLAFVHQDLGLILSLTVAENIAYVSGYERRSGLISWRQQREAARQAMERWGFDIDPAAPVRTLDPAHRALVAITRALAADARIIVLDEPTAALPRHDVEILFNAIERLRDGGVGVLYITHRLGEVSRLADRVAILRDGACVLDATTDEVEHNEMVDVIVGDTLVTHQSDYRSESHEVAIELAGVSGPRVHDVSFRVRRGEIVALVGLVSSGQREVGQLIAGVRHTDGGTMTLHGKRYEPLSRRGSLARRVVYLPASRQESGFFGFDLATNFFLRKTGRLRLRVDRERERAGEVLREWGVVPPDPTVPLGVLSGGNQQRVLLSKWIDEDPSLLVVDEPTAGVDVGARQALYAKLDEIAQADVAVIVISSDAEEVAEVAHRALVFDDGGIVAELEGDDLTAERITIECSRDSTTIGAA